MARKLTDHASIVLPNSLASDRIVLVKASDGVPKNWYNAALHSYGIRRRALAKARERECAVRKLTHGELGRLVNLQWFDSMPIGAHRMFGKSLWGFLKASHESRRGVVDIELEGIFPLLGVVSYNGWSYYAERNRIATRILLSFRGAGSMRDQKCCSRLLATARKEVKLHLHKAVKRASAKVAELKSLAESQQKLSNQTAS